MNGLMSTHIRCLVSKPESLKDKQTKSINLVVTTRDVIDSRQVDAPLGMTLSIVASIRQPYRCGRIDKI